MYKLRYLKYKEITILWSAKKFWQCMKASTFPKSSSHQCLFSSIIKNTQTECGLLMKLGVIFVQKKVTPFDIFNWASKWQTERIECVRFFLSFWFHWSLAIALEEVLIDDEEKDESKLAYHKKTYLICENYSNN